MGSRFNFTDDYDRRLPIYICGRMTYITHFNVEAFFDARDKLESEGFMVQLPSDLDDPDVVAHLMRSPNGEPEDSALTWGECLAMDVRLIADEVGAVAVIPGWKRSKGARLETFVAYQVNKPIIYTTSLRRVPRAELFDAWKGDVL